MVFKLSNTWSNPSSATGTQRGFPAPGSGQQQIGPQAFNDHANIPQEPIRPTKGFFSWLFPSSPAGEQRGFPSPASKRQGRPANALPNKPPMFGGVYQHYTPYYDRGAAAYVPNFGKVLSNPIGAGIVALQRPQASYGTSGQYANGAIYWANQSIPTSIHPQGLTDPEELAAILSTLEIQAVVRTTG